MNAEIPTLEGEWRPWAGKIIFSCPSCQKKLSIKNEHLPTTQACPRCAKYFHLKGCYYPTWKALGTLLFLFVMSAGSAHHESEMFAMFILLLAFSVPISCLAFLANRKRFNITGGHYAVGSFAAAGWLVGFLWLTAIAVTNPFFPRS